MTTVHVPTDTRIQKQCRTLADAGFEVTLLATGDGPPPAGGIPVRLLPKPTSRGRRLLVSTRDAYRAARALRADIYHFHDPELMPIGVALGRHDAKVVYDVHEDYLAEIQTKEWIAPPVRSVVARATRLIEVMAARRFDLIVAATPTIAGTFPPDKTVTIQNFPRVEELDLPNPTRHRDRPPTVAYVGDVTVIRGIREMVDAVGRIDSALDVRLLVAGPLSAPGLDALLEPLAGRPRTALLGHQSRAAVRDLLGAVRAGLVLFHPTPNHLASRPNKLYEYMAAGLPVIASDFSEWRSLIEEPGCGLVVDPLDPDAIAGAISFVVENPEEAEAMGARGRAMVESMYNWREEGQRLVASYDALCR